MTGMPCLRDALERVLDRRDLRHADARDDPRRADRAGPDAHLDAVGAVVGERLRAGRRRDVAADHLHLRVALLHPLHAVEHALRVSVRRVDHDDVDTGRDERLDALLVVRRDADRGAGPQAPVLVLARERVLGRLQDVFHGDETLELAVAVDDQHALEPVPVHELLRALEVGPFGHGDEPVALGHDRADRLVEVRLEAEVAVGDDAHHLASLDDRESREAVGALQRQHVTHRHRRRDRQRILDDTALEALHLRDFGRLPCRRHVLVDDAEATFLRHGDREAGLRHRVHRGGHERDVERDRPGEAGLEADVAGNDLGVRRDEKDVVERQRLPDDTHGGFSCAQRRIIPASSPPSIATATIGRPLRRSDSRSVPGAYRPDGRLTAPGGWITLPLS